MRHVLMLGLVGLAGLAACATPQQSCISAANRQPKIVDGLIATTRANLGRGYAVETRQVLVNSHQVCGKTPEGKDILCEMAVTEDKRVPVAIDLDEETRKLNSLLARRAEMENQRHGRIAQCIAQYPEG